MILVICVRDLDDPAGRYFELGGVYLVSNILAEYCPSTFRPVPREFSL